MPSRHYDLTLVIQDPRVNPTPAELERILEKGLRGLDPHLNATVSRKTD